MTLKKILSIEIPMHPKGKQRPRSRAGSVSHYTPKMTVTNEAYMMMMSAEKMAGRDPATGPIVLDINIFMSAPEALKKKIIKEPMNELLWYPLRKPDVDNVLKSAMDSLNGIAWLDDKQVCDVIQRKRYTVDRPRMEITVCEIVDGDEDERE